ncbi:unnamed protein product [Allacma fusca]|uniref:Terpene synthase n=1 Tax=Allacma fusca TaxID=39272 RepID=A0A8J2KUV5_9HEXA|nr:unnamed protein product [Allacma fusca]
MNIHDNIKVLNIQGSVKLRDTKEKFIAGNLTFCWPYKWESDLSIWQTLVDNVVDNVINYVNQRLNVNDTSRLISLIEDATWMAIFTISESWRKVALDNDLIFRKIVLYVVHFYMLYVLDDVAEKMVGHEGHASFVKTCGRLLQKIYMLEFPNINALKEHPYTQSLSVSPNFNEKYVIVFFDVVEDLKTLVYVTPATMKYLASSMRYVFELQTWYGSEKCSHLLDSSLRHDLRSYVIGYDVLVEFVLVVYEIQASSKVRESFYWDRLYRSGRKLGYLLNDIFSIRKELQEFLIDGKRIDNGILLGMETDNLTFEESLQIQLNHHNALVLQFRMECQGALTEDDVTFDMDDNDRGIFIQSLDCLTTMLSHLIQTHLKMERYKTDVTCRFKHYCAK